MSTVRTYTGIEIARDYPASGKLFIEVTPGLVDALDQAISALHEGSSNDDEHVALFELVRELS